MDIVNDVQTGNTTGQAADEARWQRNADDIANFLSGANPTYWPDTAVKNLLYMHLSTTKAELVARATKNYTADVAAWDAVYNHILTMSDALSDGIIQQNPDKFAGPKIYSQKEADLRNSMRKLWTDHTVWTRCYIIESVANSPAATPAATRLLKNQEDIGGAVGSMYGADAGTKVTGLLKQHILIAVDLLNDIKSNNVTGQSSDEARWGANANEIADTLAAANPAWPDAALRNMLATHLNTTENEMVARAAGNFNADVTAYDAVYGHILTMADALSDGIVTQFPKMFGH